MTVLRVDNSTDLNGPVVFIVKGKSVYPRLSIKQF